MGDLTAFVRRGRARRPQQYVLAAIEPGAVVETQDIDAVTDEWLACDDPVEIQR